MLIPGEEILLIPPELTPPDQPGGAFTLTATLQQNGATETVRFRCMGIDSTPSPMGLDAMLPLALVPAMKLGSPLRFAGPISAEIVEGAAKFQEIFRTWYPDFRPVPILAENIVRPKPMDDSRGTGLFFSGGVDCAYSLLKHRRDITHLIFIHGCDIPLDNTEYRATVSARLADTASEFGVRLVEVETDLLRFSNAHCHWGYHYHGSALIALAMMLSGSLRKIFIAASDSYAVMQPWGSSFLTDPLWNTSEFEVVHDGGEATRLMKLELVAQSQVVMRNLRVCFGCPPGGYNCGRCEKCYRTMVALRLIGALESCTVFDAPLDLKAMVEHPGVQDAVGRLLGWRINRETAERDGSDAPLIAALQEAFQKNAYIKFVREFAQNKQDIVASPQWEKSLSKIRTALLESMIQKDPKWFADRVIKWLPEIRDGAFTRLYELDRPWFRKSLWQARWRRLLGKFRKPEDAGS